MACSQSLPAVDEVHRCAFAHHRDTLVVALKYIQSIIALLHCIAACVYHLDDALAEDSDSAKLTSQNLLLKRLLNTSKTGEQTALAASTPTSASHSRHSEVCTYIYCNVLTFFFLLENRDFV